MDETCLSFNLSDAACRLPSSDIRVTVSTDTTNCYASSKLEDEINQQSSKPSSHHRPMVKPESLNASENNSTAVNSASNAAGRSCAKGGGKCGGGGGAGGPPGAAVKNCRKKSTLKAGLRQHRRDLDIGGNIKEADKAATAAELMNCCVQNTVDQAKQMHIKGTECSREDPYAALGTDTFKKLLRAKRGRGGGGGGGKPKTKTVKKKTKWCKIKTDECDGIQLQLCPKLGEGHTHQKVIEELSPVLLRATQSLDCQLREICRRLFFMKHNVPQMTAPALVNFHAILTEITRMLLADFASFPAGLALPTKNADCNAN